MAPGPFAGPPGVVATVSPTFVPPSSLMSRRAPSSMPDAFENGCPLMLFASNTPGIDVMRIATFPLFATMLPGAGVPFAAAGPDCADPLVVSLGRGAFAALLLFDPFMFPLEGEFPAPLPGIDEPPDGGPKPPPFCAESLSVEPTDSITDSIGRLCPLFNSA